MDTFRTLLLCTPFCIEQPDQDTVRLHLWPGASMDRPSELTALTALSKSIRRHWRRTASAIWTSAIWASNFTLYTDYKQCSEKASKNRTRYTNLRLKITLSLIVILLKFACHVDQVGFTTGVKTVWGFWCRKLHYICIEEACYLLHWVCSKRLSTYTCLDENRYAITYASIHLCYLNVCKSTISM